MKQNYLYTTGEFAVQNGVNKRTLHYYNDIGLFEPEVIDANGYHYYSCFQAPKLELILTLRKIGLPIEEIRNFLSSQGNSVFLEIARMEEQKIDKTISELLQTKRFLAKKAERLQQSMSAEHGKIEQITLPRRNLLLSDPITSRYDAVDYRTATLFSTRLKKEFGLYDNFGSRIAVEKIMKKEFSTYDRFFVYINGEEKDSYRPEGIYLRTYCIGSWEQLPEIYQILLDYCKAQHLEPIGYAYEEGLNELAVPSEDTYVTQILVRVVPQD